MSDSFGKPEMSIYKDHVIICGQFVMRPTTISPSQWLKFWEDVITKRQV